jgi:hypothetical protein
VTSGGTGEAPAALAPDVPVAAAAHRDGEPLLRLEGVDTF